MVRRLASVWLGVALLALTACERPYDGGPLTPTSAVAPRAADLSSYKTGPVTLLVGDAAVPDESQTVLLSPNGGRLGVGANQLTIPYGAVTEDTRFTLTIRNSPYIAAVLTAVRVSDGTLITTFNAPLTLKLSYARTVTPIPDPKLLDIFWVDSGRILGVQKTVIDKKGQALYTNLTHFSEYSPGLGAMQ